MHIFMVSGFSGLARAEGIGACTHMAQGRDQAQTCAAAVNADLPILRDEVLWRNVEPVKGQLSLSGRGGWVDTAVGSGMKCLVILGFGNPIYEFGQPSQADIDAGAAMDCTIPVRDGDPSTTADDEYFDASGRYVGFSSEGLLGDKLYFDRNGRNAGFSTEGLLSDEVHFNADGSYAGFSGEGLFGGTNTFLEEDTDFFDPED